ncbi:hypothetical protein ACWIT3_02045 [Pasteurella sp. P03HT]
MKKSIVKTSLLIGLSTLFTACGSNHTPTSQLQSAPQSNLPNTPPKTENSTIPLPEVSMPPSAQENYGEESKPIPPEAMSEVNKEENASNTDLPNNNSVTPNNSSSNDSMNNIVNPEHIVPPKALPPTPINEETKKAKWEGGICQTDDSCYPNSENPNKITIEYPQSPNMQSSTISLHFGDNSHQGGNYKFTLLGENGLGAIYFGYRNINHKNPNIPSLEIIRGKNTDLNNDKILPHGYQAKYQKSNGFLYALLYSTNNISNIKYADISLEYKNGSPSGQVTKVNDSNTVLFNITDGEKYDGESADTLTFTATGKDPVIHEGDKARFYVDFIDSVKKKGDRQYILGSGSGQRWIGAFGAEKQDTSTTTSGK